MKKPAREFLFWRFGVCAVVLGFFIFFSSRDTLADIAWHRYSKPALALWLVRNDSKILGELGNYYFGGTIGNSEYDIKRAEQAYRRAVAADPKIFWGHYQLSRIHFIKGNFEEALREANEELKANPENLRALYVRGLIYGYRKYMGDLERAENDFYRFTEWAPTEWAGYNDLIWVLLKQEKYMGALAASHKAFAGAHDAETNPWLWNSRGLAELNLGMKKEAILSFSKAVTTASELTGLDWKRAYPGNNPASASEGMEIFRKTLYGNLGLAENLKL